MSGVGARRRALSGVAVVVAAGAWVALAPGVATAVEPSTYGQPTVEGSPGLWEGDLTTPAVGFPSAAIESTGVLLEQTAPSDEGFLNEATPFGSVFGTSEPESSLAVTQDSLQQTETTLTFETPTPLGWAFALTDINDEAVQVTGTGPDGAELTAEQLGFSPDNGAFNYCDGDPLPADCIGLNPQVPNQDPNFDNGWIGVPGDDGIGGSLWFQPVVPVTSVTIFSQTQPEVGGLSTYRLWLATRVASITGSVTQVVDGAGSPIAGATLNLLYADSQPVLDPSGNPITTQTEADGTYSFDDVARGPFLVSVNPPGGGLEGSTGPLGADTSAGNAEGVNFTFTAGTAPGPNPGTDPGANPAGNPHPAVPAQPDPQLAATGDSESLPLALAGIGAVGLGGGLLIAARLRSRAGDN